MDDDEVPPFVEFNQQHMNDNNNDDCDDDLLSIAADDKQHYDGEPSVDHNHDDNDVTVTKQDLNDMKQMINDMLRNPELLHQSPVYSKTVISCQDDSMEAMATTTQAAAASISTPKNTIKSTSVSYSTSRRRTTQSSSTIAAWPISRRTTQSSMSFCQECSDSPAEVSKLSVAATRYPSRSGQKSTEQQAINFKRVVSQAPPLPFSRSSRAA